MEKKDMGMLDLIGVYARVKVSDNESANEWVGK